MKASALICKLADGTMTAKAFESAVPALEQAKQSRVTGLLDGEQVSDGVVVSTERPLPLFRFKVRDVVVDVVDLKKTKKGSR